jgi:8-oxo-dGTP pyrophosphatase MutT (NUDIX family)
VSELVQSLPAKARFGAWPPERWTVNAIAERAPLLRSVPPSLEDVILRPRGDHDGQETPVPVPNIALLKPAAVLVGLIDRPQGATLLLTQRATALRMHSGQVAFPGGRMDETDGTPLETALREAHEEIGLERQHVTPIGYLDAYLTGTGYRVTPVVARITPDFVLNLNPEEVDEVFEVPLSHVLDPAMHRREGREWKGIWRSYYAISFEERYIWGATAGIIRHLFERLAKNQIQGENQGQGENESQG